ncbi:MAG: hypothetical protein IPL46_31955 [Saprospiraceae bacterium]|nr:hypothetical protein [Saprospiraceae bacterium]
MNRFFIFLFVPLLGLNCSDELEAPIDEDSYGYSYYPLKVGQTRIYRIDSLQFDIGLGGLPIHDSTTFYLKEEIKELSIDLEGNDLYRVERSRSDKQTGPYTAFDVMTRSRSTNQGYSTENNIRLINLIFPVEKNKIWKGTSFINDQIIVFVRGESIEMFKGWEFEVLEEGVSEQIGDKSYSEIATVRQADTDNPFEKRYSIEKYAKEIGLVYRERQIVDSNCKYLGDNAACVGLEWIEKAGRGFFTREILVDHN